MNLARPASQPSCCLAGTETSAPSQPSHQPPGKATAGMETGTCGSCEAHLPLSPFPGTASVGPSVCQLAGDRHTPRCCCPRLSTQLQVASCCLLPLAVLEEDQHLPRVTHATVRSEDLPRGGIFLSHASSDQIFHFEVASKARRDQYGHEN